MENENKLELFTKEELEHLKYVLSTNKETELYLNVMEGKANFDLINKIETVLLGCKDKK